MDFSFSLKEEGKFQMKNNFKEKLVNDFVNRIDHAHHSTQAHIAMEETLEFERAIALARRKLSEDDTLIVVSADHSHTITYAGYGVSSS